QAMEFIRTRLCRRGNLQTASTPVLAVISIDLNVVFLNDIGVGYQIQDSLPDAACDVQPVDNPHICNGALTVGADVNRRLRGEVIYARPRSARGNARTASHS